MPTLPEAFPAFPEALPALPSGPDSYPNKKKNLQRTTSLLSSHELGGLNDDDAFAVAPDVDLSEENFNLRLTHVNSVCFYHPYELF